MKNSKKSLLSGSIIASALLAATSLNANAANLFHFKDLGSGEEVRTQLLARKNNAFNLELACGGKSDTAKAKKGKDGKCGEGKCGGSKKSTKKDTSKGKDGKCGANKSGN